MSIKQERFVEGSLGKDFESGLLTRIARRAAVLSDCLGGEERESAVGDPIWPEHEFHKMTRICANGSGMPEGYSIRVAEPRGHLYAVWYEDIRGADAYHSSRWKKDPTLGGRVSAVLPSSRKVEY